MRSLRKSLAILFAGILLAALLIFPQMLDKNLLFAGAESYIFYTGSQSSNAQMTLAEGENAARVKFFLSDVTGESARYAEARDAFAQAEALGARLCFCERAGDIVNYYYHTPRLRGGVEVGGMTVNLHVAVRGESASRRSSARPSRRHSTMDCARRTGPRAVYSYFS